MEVLDEYAYNPKNLIGHGAFAVVYKGHLVEDNTFTVAIKSVTKRNISKSPSLLAKEIKILRELTALRHENIVALLDCKQTKHHVHLIMEFCNAGDLAEYLHVNNCLSEHTISLFLRQLAEAMKALHDKGIVHRDLKPQNILLSRIPSVNHSSSKSPTASPVSAIPRLTPTSPQSAASVCVSRLVLKIADFGFARFLQDGVMAATMCGSPMYMAPEVLMAVEYDQRADLWSLGAIAYQCLVGKAPFMAKTPQQLKLYYEQTSKLVPKIPSKTSKSLTNLLLGLLRKSVTDRIPFTNFIRHPFMVQHKLNNVSCGSQNCECVRDAKNELNDLKSAKKLSKTSNPDVNIDSLQMFMDNNILQISEEREHIAQLNYTVILVDSMLDALSENIEVDKLFSPDREVILSNFSGLPTPHLCQLSVYARALEHLSGAMNLISHSMVSQHSAQHPSTTVSAECVENLFDKCLTKSRELCTQIESESKLIDIRTSRLLADSIMSTYAISLCEKAAVYEMLLRDVHAFDCYQVVVVVLHVLICQSYLSTETIQTLIKYKLLVEKRISILETSSTRSL